MNKILSFIVLLLITFACKSPNDFERIENFLKEKTEAKIRLSNYKALVVLNETGTCINCNFAFTNVMSDYIEKDQILFLVSSSGSHIDISAFLDANKSNVVFDYDNQFSQLNLVNHCAIIEFKNLKIDTIIEINLDNIELSIDYFKQNF